MQVLYNTNGISIVIYQMCQWNLRKLLKIFRNFSIANILNNVTCIIYKAIKLCGRPGRHNMPLSLQVDL